MHRYDYSVKLTPPDPVWEKWSSWVRDLILGVHRTEYLCEIGSRTVAEVWSKPCLDFMVGVGDVDRFLFQLSPFCEIHDLDMQGRRLFRWVDPRTGQPFVNLHVVSTRYWVSSRERSFRQILGTSSLAASTYSSGKRLLVDAVSNDPREYGYLKDRLVNWIADAFDEVGLDNAR